MRRSPSLRGLILAAGLALAAMPALAQDKAKTLADIRQELDQLSGQLQDLRGQLQAEGPAGYAAAGGDSAIDRMNAMEAQLSQLTGQTEQLQNRIDRVVKDGTTRIGDIEFRLCEMEEGCDLGSLTTPKLGDQSSAAPLPSSNKQGALAAPATPSAGAATAAEKADFDRAREVLGQGDFRTAADLFATFAETYTGGPLTGEAHFYRGEALTGLNQPIEAARAYLQSYSGWPSGPVAPQALAKLGATLARVGQTREACTTLAQVAVRYPDSPAVTEAQATMASLSCQ